MAAQKHPMETYHGIVRTPADAIKLFEACRLGLLPRVQRRLSEKERQAIRSGSVFVWDEREAGMRRWTDGKSWSASRVSGSFLTYREMEGKRGSGFNTMRRVSGKTPDSSGRGSDEDQDDGEPDGYRYKADGLMKQSFSITTSNGQHLHLISYYARPAPGEPDLPHPTTDLTLRSVIPVKGMYPESSMSDNTPIPAVARVPMNQQPPQHHYHALPPYSGPPQQLGPGHHQPYQPYGQQGYSWPPSPIATPPYSHYSPASAPYQQQQSHQPQHQGQQHSRTPPPPPPSTYYTAHQQAPLSHSLPPYSNPPPQYDHRMPLPPPQASGPGISRATPSYGQQSPMGPGSGSHLHHLSRSPGSLYRQSLPALPPVSSASSASSASSSASSAAASANTAASSYGAPPGSRTNLPPVSLSLPALSSTIAAPASSLPPTQSSPRRLSPSPTNGHSYPVTYTNGASCGANGSNKASLSALLHPTQSSSEAAVAHAANTNSAGSSPRHLGFPPSVAAPSPSAGGPGAGSAGNGAPLAMVPQQFLQPAPSGEDTRALSRLDRKFCI
ncbi:cyclic-AMP independent regulatory protein [Grosmannia clavigera kw1407]|uniref:Cyclic-AMP independent regulatory protein n=1 Tax=Grosmannia clavigera (strain kw1407 / UAMH 11150) TaxID=655863 RepID=F0XG00_GROCL|nr:cyclic-AMP independent regulatory protein [Grosmannia clavigera kw1407]EFX03404.1 cyclic-AMP independent regulatory protein [Grosmannia clavigera kw1407]